MIVETASDNLVIFCKLRWILCLNSNRLYLCSFIMVVINLMIVYVLPYMCSATVARAFRLEALATVALHI